jgi:acetyltransferase-like isoleucine patch superfamily enzyme
MLSWANRLTNRAARNSPFTSDIVGSGNVFEFGNAELNATKIHIRGNGNKISVGNHSKLNGVAIYLHGNGHVVTIGSYCVFNQGGTIWIEDERCSLSIGDQTTIENAAIAVTEPGSAVTIGEDCLLSYGIDIRTGDSHSLLDAASGRRLNYAEDVAIGNHVWIAAHCVLLKGAAIARDSVVGAGAVVTGKFEQSGVVIAGNPARIVRTGVTWSRERLGHSGDKAG